jgi:hypothetical protein
MSRYLGLALLKNTTFFSMIDLWNLLKDSWYSLMELFWPDDDQFF